MMYLHKVFSVAVAFVHLLCFSLIGYADDEVAVRAVQLLHSKCVSCHGDDQAEGGLRLDSRERILSGGERGPAISTREGQVSLLLESVLGSSTELQMPPKQPLTAEEVSIFRAWVELGSPWPEGLMAEIEIASNPAEPIGNAWTDPRNPITKIFGGERIDLWSLQPLRAISLPQVTNTEWPQQDVDHFVLRKYEMHGIAAPQRATPHELVRRLYMDLIGLPPTPESAQAFETLAESEGAATAVQQLVEALMQSPRFGEHWARHWLDVVRYSDSNGFDWDEFRPQAWRYRDYVIRSFNADKPIDQFIREQVAGDELVEGAPINNEQQDALLATGFLRMGPHDNAAKLFNEQDRSRDELMVDLVETTGTAFLGLTMSCCRCHDHKFDPLSQVDYFRMRACFAGVEFADDLPIDVADVQYEIHQHNENIDQQVSAVADPDSEASKLKISELRNGKRKFTNAMLMIDRPEEPPTTFVLFQGDFKSPRQSVQPGIISALNPNPLQPAHPARRGSSGRRLALANWITSDENPLTARVFVNRVWQQLLGQGLVRTTGDFGLAGSPPDDPELLDWLANRFTEERWSLKQLVRSIVLSATYQQASTYTNGSIEVAHFQRQPRRLTAEQLRDSVLYVSGLLTEKSSGPPEWPDLPTEVLEANPAFLDDNETKTKGWYPSAESDQFCRSIFLVQKRNTRVPLLEIFDQPENSVSCTRRSTSLVAPQALALLNNPVSVRAANALSERILQWETAQPSQVDRLFLVVLQRLPTATERSACLQFLEQASMSELCRAMLNVNEFVFLD